jgi:hypothetical protein
MNLFIFPLHNEVIQENFDKLKIDNYFYWQFEKDPIISERIAFLNENRNILFLGEIEKKIEANYINESLVKLDNKKIITNTFPSNIFFKIKILEEQKVVDLKITSSLGNGIGRKIFDFSKPTHNTRRQTLVSSVALGSELFTYFSAEGDIIECIAYKQDDKWGFLYYSHFKGSNPKFEFIPATKYKDGKELTPSDDGYMDFVYVLESQALPKAIKIGRAFNPETRKIDIERNHPRGIQRLLVLPDGRMELFYHNKFSNYRINNKREWFELGDELLKWIKEEQEKTSHISKLYKNYKEHIYERL